MQSQEGYGHVCKACNHKTQIMDNLRMHIKRKHTEKPCSFCEYKADNYGNLKEHADAEYGGNSIPLQVL
jgi:hypothetical protein